MPVVVIIGLEYTRGTNEHLTSTLTDIYIVYSFYRDLGYKVYIASDLVETEYPEDAVNLYQTLLIDSHFRSFVEENGDFIRMRRLVKTREDVLSFISNIKLTYDNKCVFYFTGHGIPEGIKMPDGKVLKSLDLRDSILRMGESNLDTLSLNNKESEIFIIFDCCNPHGLYLPYKFSLEDKSYKEDTQNYISPKILMISSSEPNAETIARHSVSAFTEFLIRLFHDVNKDYSIVSIMNYTNLKTKNRSSAYSSYPTIFVPWSWVINNLVNIQINEKLDVITIQKMKQLTNITTH